MKAGIVNMRGREYKTVALRVSEFRTDYPISEGWAIKTGCLDMSSERVVFRAAIVDPDGREVAVGFAEEYRSTRGVNSTSALENCETSAIGRALAAAGYAGQEYASADELAGALQQQREKQVFEDEKRRAKVMVLEAAKRLRSVIHESGLTVDAVDRFNEDKGYPLLRDLNEERRGAFVKWLEKGGAAKVRAFIENEGGDDE